MMMPMSFQLGVQYTVLFETWKTHDRGRTSSPTSSHLPLKSLTPPPHPPPPTKEFSGTCLAVFVLAFMYEVERLLREKLDQYIARGVQARRLKGEKSPLLGVNSATSNSDAANCCDDV